MDEMARLSEENKCCWHSPSTAAWNTSLEHSISSNGGVELSEPEYRVLEWLEIKPQKRPVQPKLSENGGACIDLCL